MNSWDERALSKTGGLPRRGIHTRAASALEACPAMLIHLFMKVSLRWPSQQELRFCSYFTD